jgi:hypothetical protein
MIEPQMTNSQLPLPCPQKQKRIKEGCKKYTSTSWNKI